MPLIDDQSGDRGLPQHEAVIAEVVPPLVARGEERLLDHRAAGENPAAVANHYGVLPGAAVVDDRLINDRPLSVQFSTVKVPRTIAFSPAHPNVPPRIVLVPDTPWCASMRDIVQLSRRIPHGTIGGHIALVLRRDENPPLRRHGPGERFHCLDR
jgi:hypothetical protein